MRRAILINGGQISAVEPPRPKRQRKKRKRKPTTISVKIEQAYGSISQQFHEEMLAELQRSMRSKPWWSRLLR